MSLRSQGFWDILKLPLDCHCSFVFKQKEIFLNGTKVYTVYIRCYRNDVIRQGRIYYTLIYVSGYVFYKNVSMDSSVAFCYHRCVLRVESRLGILAGIQLHVIGMVLHISLKIILPCGRFVWIFQKGSFLFEFIVFPDYYLLKYMNNYTFLFW